MPNFLRWCFFLWTPLALAASTFVDAQIPLEVQRVVDGDTVVLRTSTGGSLTVRLAGIDAPEISQPYGQESRAALVALLTGQDVHLRIEGQDRYKRILGRFYVRRQWWTDLDVNAEMVRSGMAWVYRQYNRDPLLLALEAEARAARRGLWAVTSEPVPPWEWRKRSNPLCVLTKRTCKDMASCEEAKFYLKECGRTRLDSNSDGIPCSSSLCR